MFSTQATHSTLVQQATGVSSNLMVKVLLAFVGSMALWASAKINIPFYPVSMTMQTFVVLVIGMSFGWKLGGATILLYLTEGALGLPVFSNTPDRGIGLAYMMGPSGGYLAGFFFSAVTVGWLAEKGWDRNVFKTIFTMLIGMGIIYALGLFWLGSVIGWDKPVLTLGFTPFVFADLLKIALAAVSLPLAWKVLKRKH